MSEAVATVIVTALGLYLLLGVLFALPFVARGVGRIDPLAREGSVGFRILIFPGTVALWPLLVRRWLRGESPPQEHNPHRDRAREKASK